MKKKLILTSLLAGVAAISLTGCDGGSDNPASDTYVDAIVLYQSNSGMTWRGSNATTLLDGQTYRQGDMLPMWKELEKKFNVTFRDQGDYSQNSTRNAVDKYMNDGYKGVTGENVELVMTTNSQTRQMANEGKLLPLDEHLDKMPNFKEYLETHPSVAAQLYQADGHIYATPYFDGADSLEKYFMLNADYVKKLLDDANAVNSMDTSTTINTVYTPFYETTAGQTVLVTNAAGTDAEAIEIGSSSLGANAIAAQNSLTTAKNGQNLVTALRNYLDDAYRYNDELKALYPNRSDIFLSASACYNVDDLVALMRCVKANPQYLAGKSNINVFFTRSGEANRQRQAAELIAFFGVRGISSESEKLYFDKNGELQDMRIEREAYEALQKVNQMYQEQLIVQNYDNGNGGQKESEWRSALLADGTGFCSYDYTGTTSPYVTGPSASYTAVLPPVADWDVDNDPDGNALTADWIHFSEDSRALKDGGWVIPADADSDKIDVCLQIMDYMFTDEGADLQDYGPNTTQFRAKVIEYDENGNRKTTAASDPEAMISLNGNDCVIIAQSVFDDIEAKELGWNNYYRRYIGSTHGIGHIRSDGLDYQTTCDALKDGMQNVSTAIVAGAMFICTTKTQGTFYSCAPSSYAINSADQQLIDSTCGYMTTLWREDSGSDSCGYTPLIKDANEINDAAIALILATNNVKPVQDNYLRFYREAYESSLEYLK